MDITTIDQESINKLARTMGALDVELDRLVEVASNAPIAYDRAAAGVMVGKLSTQLEVLEGVLDSLNFM